MRHPNEIFMRLLAIAVGLAVTLRSAHKPTRRARSFWRVLGVVCALVPCVVTIGEADAHFYAAGEVATIAAAFAVALTIGVAALAVGLRGRRVGDHGYCRRCGFDLFGRPRGTRVCGECGASLGAPRAIVVGQHQRRTRPVLVGSFVILVTLGYAASFAGDAYRWATTADAAPYEPATWLIADLWSKTPRRADAANKELLRRLDADTLGRAAAAQLVDRAIGQAMPGPTFPGVRPNILYAMSFAERAWARGAIDEATARRAMRAALDCTLYVAPRASRGRTLRYWIAAGDLRLVRPESWHPAVRLTVDASAATLDGRPLPRATWSTLCSINEWAGLHEFGNAFSLADDPHDVGPATLAIRVAATLTLAMPGRPTLVETRELTLTGTTTLVEPAAMACPAVTATPRVASDGTVDPTPMLPIAPAAMLSVSRESQPDRHLVNVRAPPDGAMLADVVLRSAGVERTLDTIYVDAGTQADVPFDDPPVVPYAIELRPVPDRGADLFHPVPTFAMPVIVPSSAIAGATVK